jgi:hypothetical protein
MDTWSAHEVERMLAVKPVIARVLFSTRAGLAQVDVYRQEDQPPTLELRLIKQGWTLTDIPRGYPPNVITRRFRHREVTPERAAATREIVSRFYNGPVLSAFARGIMAPVLALPAPPKLLALPAPRRRANKPRARRVRPVAPPFALPPGCETAYAEFRLAVRAWQRNPDATVFKEWAEQAEAAFTDAFNAATKAKREIVP